MIKMTNIRPLANKVITTMDKYDIDLKHGEIIDANKLKGTIKEFQKVVAIGPMVHYINVGDTVLVNPAAYGKPKHVKDQGDGSIAQNTEGYHVEMEYHFPTIMIDGVEHLFITDRDIDVICEIEEVEDKKIITESPLIL